MKQILIIALILSSCSTVKRYSYEAVNLQSGEISKNHERCQLIEVNRTMKGFKHTFVSVSNDTLIRFYQRPLEVNHCYYVWKTKLDK
jgi:hypothetical protein